MDDKLKDLLKRLADTNGVKVMSLGSEHACDVENEVKDLAEKLVAIPAADASIEEIIAFGLEHFTTAANNLAKEGHIKDLEHQLDMSRKPDDVDLDDEEHRHTKLHLECDALTAQIMKREAAVLLRFLEITRAALKTDRPVDGDS